MNSRETDEVNLRALKKLRDSVKSYLAEVAKQINADYKREDLIVLAKKLFRTLHDKETGLNAAIRTIDKRLTPVGFKGYEYISGAK